MVIGASLAAAGYMFVLRPWQRHWGATKEEIARPMPGDERIKPATGAATRAITIYARSEHIWPWLVQMGYGRGGWYSYDWIENLQGMRIESQKRILPEYQQLRTGDLIPAAKNNPPMEVRLAEPNRMLVIGPPPGAFPSGEISWAIGLYPVDERHTRLVSRSQARVDRWTPNVVWFMGLMELGEFLMVRKWMLGIKERAEQLAADREVGEALEASVG
jgi:hypothetical protein